MKTTQECWQALIDGETLISELGNITRLEGGFTVDKYGRIDYWRFDNPSMWSIYTPPKWYDDIPEGGVLCWVWDSNINSKRVVCIDKYDGESSYKVKVNGFDMYEHATPLTKPEIDRLRDNAPEGEG